MDWKGVFAPTKLKVIVFLVLLILANIPFVGTTSPFGRECTCESVPEGPSCDPAVFCYRMFDMQSIFWWPGEAVSVSSFSYLTLHQRNGMQESLINSNSIPLLHILSWPNLYVAGLIVNLVYFYVIACIAAAIYRRGNRK